MLYPFTFKPILKKVIWGGSDICPFKGITPVENGVGESWELSHVEGNYSIVDNGELEGIVLYMTKAITSKQSANKTFSCRK